MRAHTVRPYKLAATAGNKGEIGMKIWKKLTALVLSAACVCALVTVSPASAAETVSTFPDITDPQVGRAVEALRTMGVIDGSGGLYMPDGNLTRAAFCKLAILVMGKGDEAQAQANRTIFNDVPGSHWARGYVNLAALTTVGGGEGEDNKDGFRLMMGMGNGSFDPDRVITYGEAVTAVLRILGYVKEADLNWPNGAISTADGLGLTEGFTPPRASAAVTRAQAALLFCNMLTTPISGNKDQTYLESLNYTVKTGALLLAGDTTQNGRSGYVNIFTGNTEDDKLKLPAVHNPASFLEGTRGTAVYDKNDRFLTFLPDVGATSKTITVASASSGVLTATDGTKYTPSPSTNVWNGGSTPDKYTNIHNSIQSGTSITVCFTEAGAIDYLFVHGTPTSLNGGVMVARDKVSGNPFAQLTAGTVDYRIVKNGVEVDTSALAQYDVAAFDPSNKTLYVTDFRLTGIYESASPNTAMPTSVKVLGLDLPVLDCAVDDLKNLKLNSSVTFLLSPDGKVAGAVSSSTLRSNTVGYVDDNGKLQLLKAPSGLSELEIPKEASVNLNNYRDCLVTVTGTRSGNTNGISLSRLNGRTPSGPLNLKTRTLDGTPLAENVVVFDRIVNSGIQQVSLAAVSVDSVPASKIAYQRTNAAGEVDLLVLNDVTGDLYTYGICKNGWTQEVGKEEGTNKTKAETTEDPDNNPTDGNTPLDRPNNRTTTVTNSKGEALEVVGGTSYKDGQFIGLAASVTTAKVDGYFRHAASVALKSVEKVSPANFNMNTMLFFSGSIQLPISDDVQCYNAQTKTWFGASSTQGSASGETSSGETVSGGTSSLDNLRACLSYSSNLTVYYDRDPGQGGKVRVVVAN